MEKIKIAAYIFCLSVGSFFISYIIYTLKPLSVAPAAPTEIYIDKGLGFSGTAQFLEDNGFIRSASSFKWYGLFSGSAHLIKPGYYLLSPSNSAVEILEALINGPKDSVIKIAEGATVADIDARLFVAGITEKGAIRKFPLSILRREYPFLKNAKNLEGFLFPDTYHFVLHSPAEAVIRKMLDNFAAKAAPMLGGSGEESYHALITASLIEKEVPDIADDRAIVSGIIARRLAIGMGLQIDAAVLYAKCGGEIFTCSNAKLDRGDFDIDSPYNTYKYRGLPPTPIGNAGANAIFAALHPKKTDYLYYLSDPKTGKTIFSKTFDEHNDARAKYLGL